MLARLDELTEQSVRETQSSEPDYRSRVADGDLDQTVRANIRLVIGLLGRQEVSPALAGLPDLIGKRRATQGVPLEAVLHSFRIDFRVLWEAMISEAHATSAEELDGLLHEATRIWEVLDGISSRVATAYRRAAAELERRDEERRQQLLDQLLQAPRADSPLARAVAAEFQLSEHDRFVVVHAEGRLGDPGLERPDLALRAAGFSSAWRNDPSRQVGVVEVGRRAPSTVAEALAPAVRGRCGVSCAFDGLGHASSYVWLATAALYGLPRGAAGVHLIDGCLVESLVSAAPELSSYVHASVLGRLGGLREAERSRIVGTFLAYVDVGGSVTATARAVGRHRNTVLNHLRRLEELSGRSLSRPRDIAELVVALYAGGLDAAEGPAEVVAS